MKLIVFDLDGTLVDSQHVIVSTVRAAFEHFGLPQPAADAIRRIVGLRLVEGLARLAPALAPDEVVALAEAYRTTFQARRVASDLTETLFPGVLAMLEALRDAGFRLGIATGKSRRGLLSVLERHALADFFVRRPAARQAASRDAAARARRGRGGARRGRDDRRHDLRHRDGARCRRAADRGRLGLSPAP